MKAFIQGIKLLSILLATTLLSCNSVTNQKNSSYADSIATSLNSDPKPLKEEMFIKHQVADFAGWKTVYDADSNARRSAGLHDHIIARGVSDSNTVLLIFYMDDAQKAKAFAADPGLKTVMQTGGVKGAPEFDFVHRVFNDSTATDAAARVMIKHPVKEWEVWKTVFDGDKQARMDAGLSDRMVGYTIGDELMVTVICVVSDMTKASAFVNSKRLADKMREAGVEGQPSVFFYRIVQKD